MNCILPMLLTGALLLPHCATLAQDTETSELSTDSLQIEQALEAQSVGQSISPSIPQIIPPSPNAAALGKYGFVPVSLSAGTPSIDIPLYTLSSRQLSLSISMSYYSGGVKVDEVAPWTGLNWTLNAGGVITRVVRDRPDEEGHLNQPPPPDPINENDAGSQEYIRRAAENDNFDSEPDQFSFNFMGYTGKFVFDHNGVAYIYPYQKIKVEHFYNNEALTFRLTTINGTVYEFGGGASTEFSKLFPTGAGCGKNYEGFVETAWYLKRVENVVGDELTFSYNNNTLSYTASVQQSLNRPLNPTTHCGSEDGSQICGSLVSTSLKTCQNQIQANVATLSAITGHNGQVQFISSGGRSDSGGRKLDVIRVLDKDNRQITEFAFSYIYSYNTQYGSIATQTKDQYRLFLSKISEQDEKVHHFAYNNINDLPPRLSYSQDHWGYFNGKSNSHLIPKNTIRRNNLNQLLFSGYGGDREADPSVADVGLLRRITYPTGGYTELKWQGHTYRGTVTTPGPTSTLQVRAEVPPDDPINASTQASRTLTAAVSEKVSVLVASGMPPPDPDEQVDPTHARSRYSVYNITNDRYVVPLTQIPLGGSRTIDIDLVEGDQYRFMAYASSPRISTTVRFAYQIGEPSISEQNIPVGGARISKTIAHDPAKGATATKVYHYAKSSELTVSSGKIGRAPQYYDEYTIKISCSGESIGCLNVECGYGTLSSNSVNNVYVTGQQHLSYRYITVSEGEDFENGGEQHEFYAGGDFPGNLVFGNRFINGVPYTNAGWNHGLEREVKVLRKRANGSLVTVRKITYEHALDTRKREVALGLVARKKYDPFCVSDLDYIDAMQYKTIMHWFYLEKSTEMVYDQNGSNPVETITTYRYDNPEHAQLTHQITTGSDKRKYNTAYKYAADFSEGSTIYGSNLLRDNHMHSQVLEQTTKVGTTPTQKVTTTYGSPSGNIVPTEVKNYPTGTSEAMSTDYEYDNRGNVRQMQGPDGVPTAFIWGYNQTLPVAKVVGATYSEAAAKVNFTALQSLDDSALRSELDKLRSLVGAHVTTYTYDPLVGITSETDPNGRKMTYHYDDLNRLQWIEDNEGHVAQKFEYHYAQP